MRRLIGRALAAVLQALTLLCMFLLMVLFAVAWVCSWCIERIEIWRRA